MASGVDAETFHPGASSVEAELLPRPRVIFTGRLHPQKNLPLLLEAWTEVARRSPANLILVGPGNDRQRLTELAARWGSPTAFSLSAPSTIRPITCGPPTFLSCPASRRG